MDTRGKNMTNHTAFDSTSLEFPGHVIQALKRIIGDEQYVKIRRGTIDICNKTMSSMAGKHLFYSGSFAEGFRLKTSDRDIMLTDSNFILINDNSEANLFDGVIFLQMDCRRCSPGFTRLKIKNVDLLKERHDSLATSDGYLRNSYVQATRSLANSYCAHGPALMKTIKGMDWDYVFCIPCNTWPTEEIEFRSRSQQNNWPLPQIVDDIIQSGCHVVPVSSKYSEFEDSEWRISFSEAEYKIVGTFNHTQFLCYGLLKLVLVHIINHHFPDMLCSYFMKTLIFWEIQESENKDWNEESILQRFWKCLERLTRWVSDDNCPNFFIPKNNMFSCRFTVTQRHEHLQFLRYLIERGNSIFFEIQDLLIASHLSVSLMRNEELGECVSEIDFTLSACRAHTSVLLTLSKNVPINNTNPEFAFVKETAEECIIKNLLCKAMLLFLSKGDHGNRDRYEIYHEQVRCYMERLEEGSVTRLWAATARFAIGQYSAAINIIEFVKEVVRPIYDNGPNILADVYQRKRICLPIVFNRYYFVPDLYPEVQVTEQAKCSSSICPSVYTDWLLFVCYHHLKDQRKRDAVLNELHALLFDDYLKKYERRDITLNLVGMCYALSGNHEEARRMFRESCDLGDVFFPQRCGGSNSWSIVLDSVTQNCSMMLSLCEFYMYSLF